MKNSKKIILAAMIAIALFATIYSAWAYVVASHVFEYNGRLYWPTPGYSFLPWPSTPTGIVSQVVEPLSQNDTQYYQYGIQSGVLIILPLLLWLVVFWSAYKFRKAVQRSSSPLQS